MYKNKAMIKLFIFLMEIISSYSPKGFWSFLIWSVFFPAENSNCWFWDRTYFYIFGIHQELDQQANEIQDKTNKIYIHCFGLFIFLLSKNVNVLKKE